MMEVGYQGLALYAPSAYVYHGGGAEALWDCCVTFPWDCLSPQHHQECLGEMEGTKALSDCCVGFSQTACLQAVCRCYQHCQSLCIVENGMLRPFLTVGFSQDCISPLSVLPLPTRSVLWRWVVLCSILSFCFCKNICVLQQMSIIRFTEAMSH